jgi:predicted nucleic acid-binding protein
VKSLDTSILLYALNADCEEHARARKLVESALSEPDRWIVADQVYLELYRLLRNPAVLATPLSSADAAQTIE